jgi:hypothetical protein
VASGIHAAPLRLDRVAGDATRRLHGRRERSSRPVPTPRGGHLGLAALLKRREVVPRRADQLQGCGRLSSGISDGASECEQLDRRDRPVREGREKTVASVPSATPYGSAVPDSSRKVMSKPFPSSVRFIVRLLPPTFASACSSIPRSGSAAGSSFQAVAKTSPAAHSRWSVSGASHRNPDLAQQDARAGRAETGPEHSDPVVLIGIAKHGRTFQPCSFLSAFGREGFQEAFEVLDLRRCQIIFPSSFGKSRVRSCEMTSQNRARRS